MRRPLIRVLALSFIAQACLLCSQSAVRPASATPPSGPTYSTDWSDSFDEEDLDTSKWGYYLLDRVRNDAIMAAGAVSLDGNGNVVIRTYTASGHNYGGYIATGEDYPGNLTPSGNKYRPLYGYIEASIKFDAASGMWHSFYMVNNYWNGANDSVYTGSDEHQRPVEMDIIEHRKYMYRNSTLTDVSDKAPSTLWWIPPPDSSYFWAAGGGAPGPNGDYPYFHGGSGSLGSGFHTYGLQWTPTFLKFYYDDNLVWTVKDSSQNFGHCQGPYQCVDTDPCPGQDAGTCIVGRVPHIPEFIALCSEIPPGNSATTDALGASPCGDGAADGNCSTSGFGPYNDSSNPKMTVAYVNHYKYVMPATTDLQGLSCTQWAVQLGWTAPAGEADNSNAATYEIRCSSSPIDDSNWNSATVCTMSGAPSPVTPGTQQTQWVNGLSSCSWHYFAVRSKDAAGNWSATSNNSYCRTKCTTNGPCLLDPSAQRLPSPEPPLPFGINRVSPNPATSGLEIEYTLTSAASDAELTLFDLAGRRVAVLDHPGAVTGTRTVQWNLQNSHGSRVHSGTYWLRLASNGVNRTKMVVVQ